MTRVFENGSFNLGGIPFGVLFLFFGKTRNNGVRCVLSLLGIQPRIAFRPNKGLLEEGLLVGFALTAEAVRWVLLQLFVDFPHRHILEVQFLLHLNPHFLPLFLDHFLQVQVNNFLFL